jgi:hypothetical protein
VLTNQRRSTAQCPRLAFEIGAANFVCKYCLRYSPANTGVILVFVRTRWIHIVMASLVATTACSGGAGGSHKAAPPSSSRVAPGSADRFQSSHKRALPYGRITGSVRAIGGPPPGVNIAITGTVTAVDASGRRWLAPTSGARDFSLSVPAGSYRISGTGVGSNGGRYTCGPAATPVIVDSGGTTPVAVVCPMY